MSYGTRTQILMSQDRTAAENLNAEVQKKEMEEIHKTLFGTAAAMTIELSLFTAILVAHELVKITESFLRGGSLNVIAACFVFLYPDKQLRSLLVEALKDLAATLPEAEGPNLKYKIAQAAWKGARVAHIIACAAGFEVTDESMKALRTAHVRNSDFFGLLSSSTEAEILRAANGVKAFVNRFLKASSQFVPQDLIEAPQQTDLRQKRSNKNRVFNDKRGIGSKKRYQANRRGRWQGQDQDGYDQGYYGGESQWANYEGSYDNRRTARTKNKKAKKDGPKAGKGR